MTFEEFKKANKLAGNYWFSPDTMDFFQSKIHEFDEDSGVFITSECGPFGKGPRAYTIRKANFQTGRVSTVGGFQAFDTLSSAKTAAKKIILLSEES